MLMKSIFQLKYAAGNLNYGITEICSIFQSYHISNFPLYISPWNMPSLCRSYSLVFCHVNGLVSILIVLRRRFNNFERFLSTWFWKQLTWLLSNNACKILVKNFSFVYCKKTGVVIFNKTLNMIKSKLLFLYRILQNSHILWR